MELIRFQKVKDGKFLKNYELTYLNREGKEKVYEIVSHRDLQSPDELGTKASGFSIVATRGDELLLLREFRMGVNRYVYNLCAGMIKPGESPEECIARELYEETGLKLSAVKKILPPSFAAVALSDVSNQIAFVEVTGEPEQGHASANEEIQAAFYGRSAVKELLNSGSAFSSRAQIIAYFFSEGKI